MTTPALWRDPDFQRLWLAQAVSAFGARVTREGLPITAVLALGASPSQVGLLAAVSNGPALLVGLAAGGRVDRSRRRPIMVAADLVRAVVLGAIPVAALLHVLSLPWLYIAAALVGGASVLFEIADHAYLPSLVAREDVVRANASLSATESTAEIGGPALAGLLFQLLSAPVAIALNAGTYLLSALFLAGIKRPEAPLDPEPAARWRDDVARGFSVVWGHPLIRPVFLTTAIHSLFGGIFGALYILFCVRVVGLPPGLLGLTIAAGGVGALAGAVVAGGLSRRLGVGPALLGAQVLVVAAVSLIPLAPAGAAAGMPVLVVSQLLGDASGVAVLILSTSLAQSRLPPDVLGRANAAQRATGGGLALIGALGGGLVAEVIGIRAGIAIAAAGFLLAPIVVALSPLRTEREVLSLP